MTRHDTILAALSGAAFFVAPALANPPVLEFSLDCTLGQDCVVQRYMDRDPGPGARDYTCGPLTYDGHSGTDIRLPDFAAMDAGVRVMAAAPGIVTGLRNSVPDTGRAGMVEGQECGNGVLIDHGDGWQTQYCHMLLGSITVTQGQVIEAGTPLGLVGYSGNSEFPHLHLSVRNDGDPVDPFAPGAGCGDPGDGPLWRGDLAYQPGGILRAGFAPDMPEFETIQAGQAGSETLPADAAALVIWAYLFGARAGDELRLSIRQPDGSLMHDVTVPLDRRQAQLFRGTGLRARAGGWPPGLYQGEVRLNRDGREVDRVTTRLTVTAP